ncbi:MAG TPA: lytic transglycosylase domain-containing protein [Thermoanaerobaculia bacterium]|nr:lytic transglycosylase domain-containing protein [Thermoanaerobaculia bacterium]
MKPNRVPFTVLATMTFLVLTFNSTPSDTAIPDPLRLSGAPSESPALQDLAKWVAQTSVRQSRFRSVTSADLTAALEGRPRQLRLFPIEDRDAASRELLVALPYGAQIWQASKRHRVDGLLVAAIVEAESGFSPHAVSPRGAVGLMQILPSTGETYGARDLRDPYVNLEVGSRYLAWLLREFDGDVEMALAAYNAGPAAVARHAGMPPYRETRRYVGRVLALYRERSDRAWVRGRGRDPFAALPAKASVLH